MEQDRTASLEKFEEISSRIQSRFERLSLGPEEVERAVRWARKALEDADPDNAKTRPEGAEFE